METLILKVKNLIVINGCTDALFMGIMKNMDIKGEEILSQVIIVLLDLFIIDLHIFFSIIE